MWVGVPWSSDGGGRGMDSPGAGHEGVVDVEPVRPEEQPGAGPAHRTEGGGLPIGWRRCGGLPVWMMGARSRTAGGNVDTVHNRPTYRICDRWRNSKPTVNYRKEYE